LTDSIYAGSNAISISNLARSIVVLTEPRLNQLPVNNIQDLLKYFGTVDLKTRGAEGVQAAVGMRGGTIEQTLILIDGIIISDPQTGHHNLNIPLPLDNVQRIEIIKRTGLATFLDHNAFGGA
jgi:iron complex outermembrane receptor protein